MWRKETAEESESTVATAPIPTVQKDVTGKETGSDGDPACATARGEEEGVNLSKLTLGDTIEEEYMLLEEEGTSPSST